MTSSLGPQFLYHGSNYEFKPGEPVLPARVHGKGSKYEGLENIDGTHAEDHAFATTDEDIAWKFAGGLRGGRGRVHIVHPNPSMRPGAYHAGYGEYVAPRFERTGRTIDIMPGHQGTFPEIDWREYIKPGYLPSSSYNHPTHEEIEGGHPMGKMRDSKSASVFREEEERATVREWDNSKKTGVPSPFGKPLYRELNDRIQRSQEGLF